VASRLSCPHERSSTDASLLLTVCAVRWPDALRKSAASLLEAQGIRPTSHGGHIAAQNAVIAQFGTNIRALRSFSRLRRARNSFGYPSTETPGPSEDDVQDATRFAREVNDAADKVLESGVLSPW
jgi:hypothetical protein